MRKVKAMFLLTLFGLVIAISSPSAMYYSYIFSRADQDEAALAVAVAAAFVCAPFTGPAAVGCGLAAAA